MDTHEDEASHQDEGAANLDIMVGLLENDETKTSQGQNNAAAK